MSEEKLIEEIEKLNKKMFTMNPGTPMFNQLQGMLETAQMAYGEVLMKRRVKTEDSVMEIGTIESTEYTPDYSKQDLLNVLVQGYLKKE